MGQVTQVAIDPIDILDTPVGVIRSIHELFVEAEAMEIPADPPKPFEWRRAKWASPMPSHVSRQWWVARDGEDVVGVTYAMAWTDHPEMGFIWTIVAGNHRRRGIGSRMALEAVDYLIGQGRINVIVDCMDGVPWEPTYQRAGLRKALGERVSRLQMADVDWRLMEDWMVGASGEYELLFLEFPLADEYLQRWCDIVVAMNTAPREDLQLDDFTMTPEKWRENERAILDRDQTLVAYVAVHRETGEFAAMTDVILRHHQPGHADQDDTVTHPDHRKRGLGRLVKAAMITYLAEHHPEIDHIDTGNAGSNEAMLKINIEMGYRPILMINAWQGDIMTMRDALAAQRA